MTVEQCAKLWTCVGGTGGSGWWCPYTRTWRWVWEQLFCLSIVIYTEPLIQLLENVFINSGSLFLQAQNNRRWVGVFISMDSKMKKLNSTESKEIFPKIQHITERQDR